MKSASVLAALGATLGVVSAHAGHKHEALHQLMKKRNDALASSNEVCGCVTSVTTWYGEATLMQPTTTKQSTTTHTSTSYSTVTVFSTPQVAPYTSFSSTGVYTIPETTVTLTTTHVVPCPTAPTTDTYPPGTYTRHETTMTVTDTNMVYVCPFTSAPAPVAAPTETAAAPPAHEPAPAPAPAPAPSGEAHPPAPAPAPHNEAPAPVEAAPVEAAPAEAAPSTAPGQFSQDSSSGSGSAPIAANGNQWAMTYSPYTAEGGCKDAGAVSADISAIKAAGFTAVRLYSTDCSGLENVGNACKEQGLKVVLGVFIDQKGIDAARPQVKDIISWGQWHMVELIVIGNEALFNHNCDAGSLASFIAESKSQFQAAGYTGPCTTTETLNIWQEQGSALCNVIDVMGANIHPFFNSEVSPSDAGSFTAGQIEILSQICPGKEVYNLESGWPHAGQANGKATPGTEAQAIAIKSIMEEVGANTIFFSFEDDMWKNPGQFGVEQSWGCTKVFGGQ